MGPELLVIAVAVGTLLAGVGGSMLVASRRPVPHQDVAASVWRDAAEALEGELDAERPAALAPRRLELRADVDGARVRLKTNVPVEPTAPGSTLGVARFALGAGPAFRLHTRGPGDTAGEAGVLEDAGLVRRLRLVTDDPDAVGAAFDSPARAALAAFPRPVHLVSDGSVVRLEWDGWERDAGALVSAARLLARVSLFGIGTLRELAELPGASFRASDEGPFVELDRGPVIVAVRGVATQGGPVYSARATPASELPEVDATIDADGVTEDEIPSGVIDPENAPPLSEVGPARLRCGPEEVLLAWSGTPDRARAEAGVRLVVAIAGGRRSGGAFR